MRTNKLLLAGLSIWAVGCATQKPTAFVDLEAALKADQIPSSFVPSARTGDGWSVSRTISQTEMPAEQLSARPSSEAIREARDAIKRNLEDAKRSAKDRLFRQYLKQVAVFRNEQSTKLDEQEAKDAEAVDEKISVLLLELAKKRHPLVDSVNVYTGFPLPNVEKLIAGENASNPVKRLMADLRAKIVKIAELDAEYEKQKAGLQSEARNQAAKRRLDLEVEIQNRIDQLQAQADHETEQAFVKDQALYEGILVARPGQTSKAMPAKNERVDLQVPPTTLPKWGATPFPTEDERRQELERELGIFLAARNYERTTNKDQGVDLTKEFIEWRSQHRLGR